MNADNASGSQQELQQMKTHFPIALDLTKEMNAERRRCSPSEPLLPETINFIRHNLQRPEYHFEELPNVFVVFGASGDLSKKKIFPTLWWLYRDGLLPKNTYIIGFARSKLTLQQLQNSFEPNCKVVADETEKFNEFIKRCTYISGFYDRGEDFMFLNQTINHIESIIKAPANRLFYLALPPDVYMPVTSNVHRHCRTTNSRAAIRVIIEKPFGHDSDSSAKLSKHLGALFTEDEIYRIDHYLGKEMVQNLVVVRFGNRFIGPSWNRDHIASITISFKEDFGTWGRGGYFDKSGIIRDVMQNHLMQILTLVAMEKPISLSADDIRSEKVKVLKCIQPIELKDVVLAQYVGDSNGKTEDSRNSYTDDPGVPKNSITPTFALAVLRVHNERWEGVPFFLKCGKALNERKAEVRIQYKDVSGDIFTSGSLKRNELVLRVQPNEAVYMKLNTKQPGFGFEADETELDLTFNSRYSKLRFPDAYERLFFEVFGGQQYNFVRADELEHAWRIFTPLLHEIEEKRIQPEKYIFGSRGPESSDKMMIEKGYVYTGTYKWQNVSA